MPRDYAHLRLKKILQRLKSLILKDLNQQTRTELKLALLQLDKNYTNNQINIDEYKIKSIALLTKYWDTCRTEQFLYRETGNFFTQAEKFTICEFTQKIRD